MKEYTPVIYSDVLPVARSCLASIVMECNKNLHRETIGLLVGTCTQPALLYAFPAGPESERDIIRCSNDPDFDQLLLHLVQYHHKNRVHVLGYWHKHPGSFHTPSKGDLRQAVRMVQVDGWDLTAGPLLSFIVTKDGSKKSGGWNVSAYQLRKDLTGFDTIDLKWMDDANQEIQQSLDLEPSEPLSAPESVSKQTNVAYDILPWLEDESMILKALGFETRAFYSNKMKYSALYVSRSREAYAYIFLPGSLNNQDLLIDLSYVTGQNRFVPVKRKKEESILHVIQNYCRSKDSFTRYANFG